MREIIFRAKREDNGEWVYGYYVRMPDAAGSTHRMYVPAENPDESNAVYYIDPKTLGQYTWLTDKNGVEIFEGDIIKSTESGMKALVQFFPEHGAFMLWCRDETVNQVEYIGEVLMSEVEIIGNIHDNPELFWGGDSDD